MKTIKLTLLGIMVMLAASLRAQTTVYNNPGQTIILTSQTFLGDVIIYPQTKVLIPSNIVIKMKPNKRIIVSSGGAMLEVQGRITLDDNSNGLWEGIVVEGNIGFPQVNVSFIQNGRYPAYSLNTNGVVYLNGGTIEVAQIGIKSQTGGVVYGKGGLFYYCNRAILINPFPKQIGSSLVDCEIITENLSSDILVQRAYGLSLNNCKFINDPGHNNDLLSAVQVFEGGVYINNCTFKDFVTGIIIRSDNGSFSRPVSITQSTFTNTNNGIRVFGCDYVTIKNNRFYNNNQHSGVGTYLEGSIGFNYRGNKFYNYPSAESVFNGVSTFKNSGGLTGNMAQNNYYWNCFRPVLATDNNRGLQIKCNDFVANFSSYVGDNIMAYGFNNGTVSSSLGIPDQGALVNNDNIGYHLAGNLFTNIGPSPSSDIDASNGVPDFTYFHHKKVGIMRVEPIYIQSPKVSKRESDIATSETRNQACWLWLAENKPVAMRMNEHIGQLNQLISGGVTENHASIRYMNQIIEHDVAEYAIELVDAGEEETLLTFLRTNTTNQKRMMLVQYFVSSNAYDSAAFYINTMVADTTNSDLGYFIAYYSRLIDILQLHEGERILNASDSAYFLELSALNTPIAAKAKVLLGLTGNSAENDVVNSVANINVSNTNISLYPQPAYNTIYIKDVEAIFQTYTIYDISMRKILTGKLENEAIDVHQLNNGIYYLFLIGNDQQASKKIIISK